MIKTLSILKDLISIPSFVETDKHDERDLIEYVINFVKSNTNYKYYIQDVEGHRKNILVYKKPNPKIALFGHMDTVLPKAETKNPFKPRVGGDKIYGLGSVDMKSGLAIMLKLAQEINNDDLALVFSVDEEYEFKGALKLKQYKGFNPEFIINIEPTDNKILNGCRGITEFSFIVHGKSVHSGRKPFGINAIENAVKLIDLFQKDLTKIDMLNGGKSYVNLAYIHGGTLNSTDGKKTEISGLGMIVPNYAEINCEIRIANPKITQEFVEKKLHQIAKRLSITLSDFHFKFYLGSMLTPRSSLKQLEKCIKDSGEKAEYADISLAGYYEVQLLQENWKSKSVIYGAGPINLSHSANEYLSISSLKRVEKVIRKFIEFVISND